MTDSFSAIDAIVARRSVRTYSDRPLGQEDSDKIRTFISGLTNPLGLTGIDITLTSRESNGKSEQLGTYGFIKNANTFLVLTTPSDSASLLMAGYEFEHLILYITSLDLGTVWFGGTFNRRQFAKVVDPGPAKILPAVSPVGYPEQRRFSERIVRSFLKSDKRKPWTQLFFDGDFNTPLLERAAEEYAEVLEMVRLAPSATNTQPWRIVRLNGEYHFFGAFDPAKPGLETTMRYLDMGIAICHFDLTARERGLAGDWHLDRRPTVIAIPSNLTYIATWSPRS